MSRAQAFFRPVPVDSPVHRLAPETKVVAGVVISIGLVFNPLWSHVLVAAALVIAVFLLAKLPRSVLPRIPLIVKFALFGGALGAFASGEEPFVLGIGVGGLLDYARLIVVGIVMILWAGILSWTTGLTAVGFAIRRLLRPLRRVGLPVDEIGTVVALAVRSLPLVADEIDVVSESVNNRPSPADLRTSRFAKRSPTSATPLPRSSSAAIVEHAIWPARWSVAAQRALPSPKGRSFEKLILRS